MCRDGIKSIGSALESWLHRAARRRQAPPQAENFFGVRTFRFFQISEFRMPIRFDWPENEVSRLCGSRLHPHQRQWGPAARLQSLQSVEESASSQLVATKVACGMWSGVGCDLSAVTCRL